MRSALALPTHCSCSLFSHYIFPHKSVYSYTYYYNNRVLEQLPHNGRYISNAVWERLALLLPHASVSSKFYLDPYKMTQCINRHSVTQFPKSIQLLWITAWTIPHLAGLSSGSRTALDLTSQYESSNKKRRKSHLRERKTLKVLDMCWCLRARVCVCVCMCVHFWGEINV